jgi:hypothetical protein
MPDNFEKRTEHETKFHDLTEEEYDALDEKWTKNPPKPGPNGLNLTHNFFFDVL